MRRQSLIKVMFAAALMSAVAFMGTLLKWHSASPVRTLLKDTPRVELIQREQHWYRKGETNLFSGWMVDYYPGGQLLARCQITDGVLNGISETWYTNGQIQLREHFQDGVSDGLREKWHENGQKASQALIADGKMVGTFRSWHDNGQLFEQIELKRGRPDGVAWAYYPSGFLKAQTAVRDGQVLNRRVWSDGEQKPLMPR